jgi:hypothetical protein
LYVHELGFWQHLTDDIIFMPEKNGETVLYPGKVDPHHLRVPRLNALVHKPDTVVLTLFMLP